MNNKMNGSKFERGVALILALISILVLSVLASGLVFVTQTQIWTSFNYRLTTQARYAAEAGVQRTMNWILNSYTAPSSFSSYDLTKYPVQYSSAPVVLSALSGVSANYPDSTVQSAFNSALSAQSLSGVPNTTFSTYATLLHMTAGTGVSWLGGGGGGVAQTWQITSQGSIAGLRSARVQVVATFERPSGAPIFTYGVAGSGTACPAVNFSGGTMDAWNSASGTYTSTHQNSGGNIGSNGNVTLTGGSTRVYGTISDTNITVGGCPDGITNSVGGTPWNGLQQLSQALSYPAPIAPSPMTSTTNLNVNSNTCWGASPPGCTVIAGPAVKIAPGSYRNITSNSTVHLTAGTYDINSLNLNGGSVTLDSVPVVINLGGNGISAGGTLFTSNSSTTINTGGIPANLQIVSAAGAGMSNPPVITMNSSSAMYAIVYAPNAYVHITGSSQFLGAVVGNKVTSDSSGGFHFDMALLNSFQQLGPFVPINFSWSKF